MVIVINNEYKINKKCLCKDFSSDFKILILNRKVIDKNITNKKFFKIGGNFCVNCKGFVYKKYKHLIKDSIYKNDLDEECVHIISSNPKIKTFLDKFKKQKFILYKTVISNLKNDHLEIIESLWQGGLIKLYRKKRNPKLTTLNELDKLLSTEFIDIISNRSYQIYKIGLTSQGRGYLENFLKWDISSQLIEFKRKISVLITEKLNFIKSIIIQSYSDLRIKKIIEIFENIDFYERKLNIGDLKLDILSSFDKIKDIINLLALIVEKINNRQTISLKSILTDFPEIKKNARTILSQILNTNLILFNIFPEPFGRISISNLIFNELQKYNLNFFESEFKNYIITQLKKHVKLEKIWDEQIPQAVKGSIKGIYFSNGRKYFSKSDLTIENEFNSLISNHRLEELLSYSYFSSISKIITYHINWEQIFKLEFKHFNDSNEFEENFNELNLIRNKLAHKSKKKFDFFKYLQKHNLILSDILRKYYYYSLPFSKLTS